MNKSKSDDERHGVLPLPTPEPLAIRNLERGIDKRLPENPTPAQLALYFALGWAQSTTTWAWPDSDRWRTLFAAGPGEHWLVRSQWHLCKLTDDPRARKMMRGFGRRCAMDMATSRCPGMRRV